MLRAFLSFDTFVFPKIAVILYWIGLVFIILGTIVGVIGGLLYGNMAADPAMGAGDGFLAVIVALVGGIVGIVFWRLVVEFWLVIFSIRDTLRDIRDQGRRP